MAQLLRRLAISAIAWAAFAGAAFAQSAIPGLYLSGTAPTGFSSQNLLFHCSGSPCSSNNAWPLVELYTNGALNAVGNPIWISPGTGATFAVTGTFWQTTQPVSGTFWQATQPVSGTVTANLGTIAGAATSANQPTNASQGSTTSGQTGTLMMGAVSTSAPTLTNAQTSPFSIDPANGGIRVSGGVGGGPQGTQTIANSQAVNPATSTIWPITNTPDTVLASGNITTADTGTTCSSAGWGISSQSACTGTPTSTGVVSGTAGPQGWISVEGILSGGTATMALTAQVSPDGGTTWFNSGLYIVAGTSPTQVNAFSANFFGWAPAGGFSNYRISATTFTTLTGSPSMAITIRQGMAAPLVKVANLPSGGVGTASTSGLSVQGAGGSALPIGTNAQQQAGLTLAAPTAPGVPAASGLIPTVNSIGTVLISGFAPNGNTLSSPATITSSPSAAAVLPTGTTDLFANTGSNLLYVRVGNGSVSGTVNDIPIQPGSACALVVGANTDFSAISPLGSTLSVVGGSGLGTCPSGGGGGSGSDPSVGANGATGPTSSTQIGSLDASGFLQPNSATDPLYAAGSDIQAAVSVPINISTASTVQLVAISGSAKIYVTSFDVIAGGTGSFTLEYGSGVNCATGTTALTGAYPLTAQAGVAKGSGLGPVLFVPSGKALCAVSSAAVQMSGSLSYNQQ